MKKLDPFIRNIGSQAINQLSTKVGPKRKYRTDRKDLDGGALARRRGPSSVDKAAYVMSNFLTPAPSFAGLAKVLAGQAFKGVKDNVDYYRGSGIIDSLLTSGVKGSPWQVDINKGVNLLTIKYFTEEERKEAIKRNICRIKIGIATFVLLAIINWLVNGIILELKNIKSE